MQGQHHRHQMQTYTGAGDAGCVTAAVIALKQALSVARRYTDAVVADVDHQPVEFAPGRQFYRASGRRIFDCIGNQIAEYLKQQLGVTIDGLGQRQEIFSDQCRSIGVAMRLAHFAQERGGVEVHRMVDGISLQIP